MIIIDFQGDHARTLYDGNLNSEKNRPAIEISQFMDEVVVQDLCFTGIINEEIVACGGIYPMWDGVGEAWFIGSKLVYKHPILITKTIRQYLNKLMNIKNFHRVQAYVKQDWEQAKRWIELVGMQKEGMVRKFSPDGRDHILYAKVN